MATKCAYTQPYNVERETYGLPNPVIALLTHMMEQQLQLKWAVQLDDKVTKLTLTWQRSKGHKNGKRLVSAIV